MKRTALYLGLTLLVVAASVGAQGASQKPQKWSEDVLPGTWKGKLPGGAVEITLSRQAGRLAGTAAVYFAAGMEEYQLVDLAFDGSRLAFKMKREGAETRRAEMRLVSDVDAVFNGDDATAPDSEKNIELVKGK